jgi:MoxR-like ATPase
MTELQQLSDRIMDNVSKVIVGKRAVIELIIAALLCEGHILLEDVPGTGKTMMARAVAISLGGSFKRIQCTPDLLPNDITGVSVFNQQTNAFDFRPGPIFVNILLADEINRATPRTQSALLEAMQEQQVTVDGITRELPRPFCVIATQNPIEYEGTFVLPEAQLDRFLLRLSMGYPEGEEEKQILLRLQREHPILHTDPVIRDPAILNGFQNQVWEVFLDETLHEYIIRLVAATRQHSDLALGASPRASLALFKASQALAAIRGRDHVLPDDIKYLITPVLAHRLIVRPEAELRGRTVHHILADIVKSTPLPVE